MNRIKLIASYFALTTIAVLAGFVVGAPATAHAGFICYGGYMIGECGDGSTFSCGDGNGNQIDCTSTAAAEDMCADSGGFVAFVFQEGEDGTNCEYYEKDGDPLPPPKN